MKPYEMLKYRLDLTIKEIENLTYYADEDDDFTEGYAHGLQRALECMEYLTSTINNFYERDLLEDKLTSSARPADGQMKLPLD